MRLSFPSLSWVALAMGGCYDGQLVQTYERDFAIDETIEVVELEHRSGDLQVMGGNQDEIHVRAELRTWRVGSFEDDRAEDSVIIDGDEDDGVFELVTMLLDPPGGYFLDVVLTVPDRIRLDLSDDSGNASIEGVDGLDIHDDSGDLYVTNVSGEVRIVDASGDLEVVDVEGPLFIEDGSGDITVYDVDDDVEIRDGSGDIFVRSVEGTVTLWDGSGDIDVRDAGEVLIKEDGSGEIDVD